MEVTEQKPEHTEEHKEEQQGFKFVPLGDDARTFPNFHNKDVQAKFF